MTVHYSYNPITNGTKVYMDSVYKQTCQQKNPYQRTATILSFTRNKAVLDEIP